MVENEVKKTGAGGEIAPVISQKPWFFAMQSSTGAIIRGEADSATSVLEQLNGVSLAWVDYIVPDFATQVASVAKQMGFSHDLVSTLTGDNRVTYEDLDVEMGFRVPSIQVRELEVIDYPLLFLIRKGFVLTIHPLSVDRRFVRLRRYSETFIRKIPIELPVEDRMTMLLMRLIDHNNDRNFEHLRQIEERSDKLHESMIDISVPRTQLGPQIYQMKHALIAYLNGLWDSVDVLHALRYGDAELISDDPGLLQKLGVLGEDVNQQIGLAEHMSEVLASGLEVLQSIYNNQLQELNNRLALLMTYMTIFGTAVLVPNTIATMLGNTAFAMDPSDRGWYLALMAASTVLATWGVYWWIKKKGWLPKHTDDKKKQK
jgi:magnesium transporter